MDEVDQQKDAEPRPATNERAILMERKLRSNLFRRTKDYFFNVSLMVSGVSFWTVTLRVMVVYPSSFSWIS